MKGSCLCGAVRFEVGEVTGPFELCHCSRCRKVSGSAHLGWLGARTENYRITRGRDCYRRYEAPVVDEPPGYTVYFCDRCGSPLPEPEPGGDWFEIPPGMLDDELAFSPQRHIYTDKKADWDQVNRQLPEYTGDQIRQHRRKYGRGPTRGE